MSPGLENLIISQVIWHRCSLVHLLAHIEEEGDHLKKLPRTSILAMMYMLIGLSITLQSIKYITPQQYVT